MQQIASAGQSWAEIHRQTQARRNSQAGEQTPKLQPKVSRCSVTELTFVLSPRTWDLFSVVDSLGLLCRHLFFLRSVPRHTLRLKPPLFSVKNTGYISVWQRVAFSFFRLVPELISSPVQFLTRNIHSLIPILRHHPRPLLPPVPPLDSPVPHGAAMMGHTGPTAAGGGGAQAGKCVL